MVKQSVNKELSPLLFALFIAELEKRIQELIIGVRVGGKKLGVFCLHESGT